MKLEVRKVLKAFGHRVLELRSQRQMTQEGLAEALGWLPRRVQRVEAGEANLSIAALVELANALDTPLPTLLSPASTTMRRRPGRPRSRQE